MRYAIFSLIFVAVISQRELQAVTYHVCQTGCDFNLANSAGQPVRAAVNAAQPGDVIELEAGQTFVENVFLPYKEGSSYITIRSSKWDALPDQGTRIDPVKHAALMPTILPGVNENPLYTGSYRLPITALDLETNVATFAYSLTGITEVSCASVGDGRLPAGIEPFAKYYLRNVTGMRAQLSSTPDGDFVDIQDAGAGQFGCTNWKNGHHYRFIGLRFAVAPGQNLGSYPLATIGTGDESSLESLPHHIHFEHCIFTGNPNEDSPRTGLILNGKDLSLIDSWVGQIKQFVGESKTIVMYNTPGPVEIRNNYLSAASIGILSGGAGNSLSAVTANVTIVGNHIQKVGGFFYREGNGPPVGACYYRGGSGAFYRDVQAAPNTCPTGACYECKSDGTWGMNQDATYRRQNFLTKSGIEFKNCDTCRVEGNVIEGTFAGPDGGNVQCINIVQLVQGGAFHYIANMVVENNWCIDTWSGISVVSTGERQLTRPSSYNLIRNNLMTGLGNFPAQSMWPNPSDVYVRPLAISGGQEGLVVDHNTARARPTFIPYGLLFQPGPPQFGQMKNVRITNNIVPAGLYTWFLDQAPGSGCAALGFYLQPGGLSVASNLFFGDAAALKFNTCPGVQNIRVLNSEDAVGFANSTDGQLADQSQFAASCTNNCAPSDTDGTTWGVDMVALRAATSGVVAGETSWKEAAAIDVAVGSSQAIISFRRLADSCQVRTFRNAARLLTHADTATPELQSDSRDGNQADGPTVQFVTGTHQELLPSTHYWGLLACGEKIIPFDFQTESAGTTERHVQATYQGANTERVTVAIADNPAMSNATILPSVQFVNGEATVEFTIPARSTRYVRWSRQDASGVTVRQSLVKAYVNR